MTAVKGAPVWSVVIPDVCQPPKISRFTRLFQPSNVAVGAKTSLLELYELIRARLAKKRPALASLEPTFQPFRPGDIKDSQADISRAKEKLGYAPTHTVAQGMDETVAYLLEGS